MLTLQNVRVTGFSRVYFDIYWEVAPHSEDIQEYEFYVERSEAEAGPWDVIAGPLIDRYYVRDNTTPQISVNRTLFYRVRMYRRKDDKTVYSSVEDRWGRPDLIAAEIVRLESLLFREYAGTKAWLFPRRTFGQRCPQCWDDVLGKRLDDSCPTCFGTGFSGGYHYPIEFWLQIDDPGHAENLSTHDHNQQQPYTLRCPPSPSVKPLDLLIDHMNRRFRLIKTGGTSKHGVQVRQEASAILLQPGSIEDAIPLKVDLSNLAVVPWRNFTGPQDPFEAGATPSSEIDKMLGRWGYSES